MQNLFYSSLLSKECEKYVNDEDDRDDAGHGAPDYDGQLVLKVLATYDISEYV